MFLLPAFVSSTFRKCQLFCITRAATDIICAWIKDELRKLQSVVSSSIIVEKLTGDNTRSEKDRVMSLFKEDVKMVLVCTDVAGMGVDVTDLNFAVNIGVPKNTWKVQQQIGRIGRGGDPSMSITLVFPQKGKQAPEPILRDVFKRKVCMRKGMNDFFSLSDPFIDYTVSREIVNCNDCSSNEGQWCQCSLCCCCSVCSESCTCPPPQVMIKTST